MMTKNTILKIGLMGANGKMGQKLAQEIAQRPHDCELIATTTETTPSEAVETAIKDADLIIDFTTPVATMTFLELAQKHKTAMVIGTTGLNKAEEDKIQSTSQTIPILYAANMSLGVTLLTALVEQAAARLGDEFDIEIFESHHKHKIDAPSGTALALGRAAALGRNIPLDDVAVYDGHTTSPPRKQGDIGFSVVRGGDIAGEHNVMFLGDAERLELSHKATDRKIFARGAVTAALWLRQQPAGLYNMKDVLSLNT